MTQVSQVRSARFDSSLTPVLSRLLYTHEKFGVYIALVTLLGEATVGSFSLVLEICPLHATYSAC